MACCSSPQNSTSALEHNDAVDAFIEQQLAVGYMSGPFLLPNYSGVIISNLAVVPKKTPGKWHVIVNLSRPHSASVNNFIKREFTHVAYSSVDDAALIIHTLRHNTELAKFACDPIACNMLSCLAFFQSFPNVACMPFTSELLTIVWPTFLLTTVLPCSCIT